MDFVEISSYIGMDIWIFNGSFKFRWNFVNISEVSSKFRRNFVKMSGFGVPPELCDGWCLPAALRRPQKKHAPGILEHVSCVFCRFLSISAKCYWLFMICSDLNCFCRFEGLPAGCVCVVAACGASATSDKTRPWNFGACILWISASSTKNQRKFNKTI